MNTCMTEVKKPKCTTHNPPHEHGKWEYAVKRDYLSRGEMPKELCNHIVKISE